MKLNNFANRGRALESIIMASQANIVRLIQVSGTAKRIGGGKMIQTKGPVDFSGVIVGSGRAICFDAKTCGEKNHLDTGKDKLLEHQRQELLRMGEAGAIAGLLCLSTARQRYYWCDWRLLTQRRPSILWDTMADMGDAAFTIGFKRLADVAENYRIAFGEVIPCPRN